MNISQNGQLFVITAPSGAGKTSLVRALLEKDSSICLSISHTTRPPRDGEVDGGQYYYLDRESFLKMSQEESAFVEFAEVFGNYYGTSTAQLNEKLEQGKDVILEIDWQGAQQVKRLIPECTSIFILPPSREELLNRLRKRGKDSEEVIERRYNEARDEMSHYGEFDYLVVNDDFDQALEGLHCIIRAHRQRIDVVSRKQAQMLVNILK